MRPVYANFRSWVPGWLAVLSSLFVVIVSQSVCSMYGVLFHHIAQSDGLDAYDPMMMLRVMLIGGSCFFLVAIKLKSVFSPKEAISISLVAVLSSLAVLRHIHAVPAVFAVGIVSGFFQIYGTFEILGMFRIPFLKKTNFGVFISFVFLIILGCTDIFAYVKSKMTIAYGEDIVFMVTASAIALAFLLVQVLMKRGKPAIPPATKPFWAISLSELLFITLAVLALVLFVFHFEENGWARATFGQQAFPLLVIAVTAAAGYAIIARFSGVRLIDSRSFCFKEAIQIALIFLILDFALSSDKYVHIGPSNNLYDLAGLVIGFALSVAVLGKGKGDKTRFLTCTAFASVLAYAALMFISTRLGSAAGKGADWLPAVFLGIGQMILFCTFNAWLMERLSVPLYFHAMFLLGCLRNCIGVPLGGAIIVSVLSSLQPGKTAIPPMCCIYGIAFVLALVPALFCLLQKKEKNCIIHTP